MCPARKRGHCLGRPWLASEPAYLPPPFAVCLAAGASWTTSGIKCVAALLSACWPNYDGSGSCSGSGFWLSGSFLVSVHGNRVRCAPAHEYPAYEALLLYFTAASLLLCAHMENQAKCIWQAARASQARITERNESE